VTNPPPPRRSSRSPPELPAGLTLKGVRCSGGAGRQAWPSALPRTPARHPPARQLSSRRLRASAARDSRPATDAPHHRFRAPVGLHTGPELLAPRGRYRQGLQVRVLRGRARVCPYGKGRATSRRARRGRGASVPASRQPMHSMRLTVVAGQSTDDHRAGPCAPPHPRWCLNLNFHLVQRTHVRRQHATRLTGCGSRQAVATPPANWR
jgi:hypothetical protein